MNNRLPKVQHIDPREARKPVVCEAKDLTEKMRQARTSPYRYIRNAMSAMVKGEYQNAFDWLVYAEGFVDVFYLPGSLDNRAFTECIKSLKLEYLFLSEKFQALKPEE